MELTFIKTCSGVTYSMYDGDTVNLTAKRYFAKYASQMVLKSVEIRGQSMRIRYTV